jgi:hypothetical protein
MRSAFPRKNRAIVSETGIIGLPEASGCWGNLLASVFSVNPQGPTSAIRDREGFRTWVGPLGGLI